ncbi:sensor histidine kinase [Blautia sp. MSJ-19]|uniref:sensor histidine kinase n=1 Tax=Blautia sp. MSJ-19 TaxID=2841517 RepID=UPI001C0E999A|nr:sensor histidine kinase [Blautia sp. MSJ-19]MBU5480559.1 sensor histidine kinase [Blautia sp. MSJ-19]
MSHLFSRIRHSYGDMKLESKFTLVLLLAATVPVIMMACFFYGKLYDMVVSYTIRQEQDTSAQTAPYIEDLVQQIIDAHDEITDQEFFQTLFHQPVNSPFQMFLDTDSAQDFHACAENMIASDMITGIQIFMDFPPQSVRLFNDSLTKDYFSPMSKARGTYWYGIFQGTQQSSLFCPAFYLGEREKENYGDLAYITSTTFYYQGNARQAYIAVYSSSEHLTGMLKANLTIDGSVSYIINERNAIVASSNDSLSGIYLLDYNAIEDSFMSSNNFIERDILDTRVYAGFYNIKQPGWFMVTVLPSGPLITQSNTIMIQYILMYLGFLVFALVLAHFMSHSITNRISSVIHQMSKVRKGTLSPMESPEYHDEIGDLIDTYNYMTRKMDQLMTEQAKAAEELRIAEFHSLQAQINPHFLYNTMDMINWLAQQGRTEEVSQAVQSLSRFYKLTLSRKQSISTISREAEHVDIYLQIQNMRYHDSITFILDIPDELLDYQIPKLTLQPIIENSVLHGILEKSDKTGTIVLTGWMEDSDIVLLISDDGVGISSEKLSTILSGEGISPSGGTNIAVYNTHRRLQILYGPDYGLKYSSKPEEGTEVEIRIPARK